MKIRAIAIYSSLLLSLTAMGHAQINTSSTAPILFKADNLSFDKEKNTITATGHVEVYQEKEVLTTDLLVYDRAADKITATGHIVWQQADGDVFFGSYAELQDQMKDGIIREFRGYLIDESRLAANLGTRRNGTETQMDQVVYSPCKLCKDTPEKDPLWQLKAETAIWDEVGHDIIYTDARMEFFGVPVFYTPYLRHPDSTVEQRSGILAPSINTSKDLGFYAAVPYYHVISPDKDVTLMPLFTENKGSFLSGEYRQRFSSANLSIGGSIGNSERLKAGVEKKVVRGHFDSTLNWDINENWRFNTHILKSSDKTYLRQFAFYGHTQDVVLTSNAKLEGFYGLNYMRAQGFSYQPVRAEDRRQTIPVIAPALDFNYISPKQLWDSRFYVDANALVVTRKEGSTSQRLSTTAAWKVPFASTWGDRYAVSLRLRGDGYNTRNFTPTGPTLSQRGTESRVLPQAFLEWEYPWIKALKSGHVIVSPVASLVVAPRLGNPRNIPNEDCSAVEPNDTYILHHNRFPGLDCMDDGSRMNYGLKADTRLSKDVKGGVFLGQSIRFSQANPAFAGTGFDKKYSDYVGRAYVSLYQYFDARYRFRLSSNNLSNVRSELKTSLGVPIFKVHVDYLKLPRALENLATPGQGGHQIAFGVSSAFAKGWSTSISTTRDLGNKGKVLSHLAGVTYDNECLNVGLQLSKNYFRDSDIKPGTGFMFVLAFKTLGGQTLHQFMWKKTFDGVQDQSKNGGMFANAL